MKISKIEAKTIGFRFYEMNMHLCYIQAEIKHIKEIAKRFWIAQPRVSDLVYGEIDLLSVGMLPDLVEHAQFSIYKN